MSFPSGGQLSTDKLVLNAMYIFIVPFPVWAGIVSSPHRNGIINMWPKLGVNFLSSLSVDNLPL